MNLFPENGPVGVCCHCKEDVYNEDYIYNGDVFCRRCWDEIGTVKSVVEFAAAYPETLIRYLEEIGVISEEPEAVAVIEDFGRWAQNEYDEWVAT